MSRRLLLVLSAGALAATGLFTSGAAKASTAASTPGPAGGACQLTGTATFAPPGLGTGSSNFTYGFTGTLTNCQSNNGAPASGTVFAQNATGTGGCSNSTTQGTSVSQWAGGTTTVVSYKTTGAGALVALQGTVIPSVTIGTTTYTTNEPSTPVGSSALGELTFSTSSPTGVTACNSGGLTSAAINGFIEIGHQ